MTKRRGTFKTEAVEFAGLICVVSGDDHTACGTIEAYNPFSNEWYDLPSLPRRLMLVSSSSVRQTLYITGGLDKDTGEYSDKVYSLHINAVEWVVEQATLLKGRYGHGSATLESKIYVAGGQLPDPEGYTNTVEIFDHLLNRWSAGPPMINKRIWLRLLTINNEIYAVGGDVDENGTTKMPSIEKLDSKTNTWVHVSEFTLLRRVFSVTSIGSEIFVFGGRDADYATLNDWDKYNVETSEWESTRGVEEWDTKDNLLKRLIPRDKFYGGQAVAFGSQSYESF